MIENDCLATFVLMTDTHSAEPIDAVITWVDGSQPAQQEKLKFYIEKEKAGQSPNVISSRFDASGEIKYCLVSILNFAPFIRHIYIVTDGQKPDIEETVAKYFPERLKDIKYVDHQEIFKGYEQYLPVFNSRSIESMLWRIPGISERFICFNDDFFIVKPLSKSDWVQNGKLVLRGKWSPVPIFHLLWHRVITSAKKRRASFHLGQWNAAWQAGYRFRYFVFEHTPYSVSKSVIEEFYAQNPDVLERNVSYRFRHPDQFNPCSLSYHLCLRQNKAITRRNSDLIYLQPHGRANDYIAKKIKACENDSSIKFMCVQDLSISTEEQRNQVFGWLNGILGLND